MPLRWLLLLIHLGLLRWQSGEYESCKKLTYDWLFWPMKSNYVDLSVAHATYSMYLYVGWPVWACTEYSIRSTEVREASILPRKKLRCWTPPWFASVFLNTWWVFHMFLQCFRAVNIPVSAGTLKHGRIQVPWGDVAPEAQGRASNQPTLEMVKTHPWKSSFSGWFMIGFTVFPHEWY